MQTLVVPSQATGTVKVTHPSVFVVPVAITRPLQFSTLNVHPDIGGSPGSLIPFPLSSRNLHTLNVAEAETRKLTVAWSSKQVGQS
jgi:hypothetical protein